MSGFFLVDDKRRKFQHSKFTTSGSHLGCKMANRTKNEKYQKSTIDCASGDKCGRRNCLFKHPDGWNPVANQRKNEQEQRANRVQLQIQQQDRFKTRCYNGDLCRKLGCRYEHSRHWDPERNQQLYEEKRHRDEQRREEQRKHAINISTMETIEQENELNNYRTQKKSPQKDVIGEEYEYDDDYFDIQEKIWEKQSIRY